ncbi:glycosyltransferase [Alteromonas sp. 14N.309.X.WAT.G.H12]|uniref:glycosyltransferase n=1 Tax=Alteromonas sp. 14N.309.X.WAT.G.H12 TaxID=3120824 RepID=UPI002FCEA1C6
MSTQCVAHLTYSFGYGGLEKVIANTILHSQHYPNTQHIIISLIDNTSLKETLPSNVEVFTLNKRPGTDLRVYKTLYRLLKDKGVTVFHTYNFCTIEYHAVAKACGVPRRIHADHGMGGDSSKGTCKKRRLVRRMMSHFVHKYVVVSNDLKRWVISSVGVNEEKVKFVFNGVATRPRQPVNPAQKDALSLVCVGRLEKVKNHARLLHAIASFKQSRPNVKIHCNIVGEGNERAALKQLTASLSLNENITFCGLQSEVIPYLNQADGFILSSDYEAMPITILEAMSCTLPVICPKVGGVTDFISEKEAILVKGQDSAALARGIERLYGMNTATRQTMADQGLSLVNTQYSIETMIEVYFGLYQIEQLPAQPRLL